jgi:hypothetical protein
MCDISNMVTVSGNNVNLAQIGTYMITYTCTNHEQLSHVKKREVVVADRSCPTCAFNNTDPSSITVEASFPYDPNDHLPMCTDDCGFHAADTNREAFLTCEQETQPANSSYTESNVDVEQTGTYQVTYHAFDFHNDVNSKCDTKASYAVRTVVVVDTMSPIIGLKFDSGSQPAWGTPSIDGKNPAHGKFSAENYKRHQYTNEGKINVNPARYNFKYMAEVSPSNAWMLGAAVVVAATAFVAVSGSAKKTTFVPV